jgi:hypothetical protein
MEFCSGIFVDPEKRPTAAECLESPWVIHGVIFFFVEDQKIGNLNLKNVKISNFEVSIGSIIWEIILVLIN